MSTSYHCPFNINDFLRMHNVLHSLDSMKESASVTTLRLLLQEKNMYMHTFRSNRKNMYFVLM